MELNELQIICKNAKKKIINDFLKLCGLSARGRIRLMRKNFADIASLRENNGGE